MTVACEWLKVLHATLSGNVTPTKSRSTSAVSMAMPGGSLSVCLQKPHCVSAWLLPAAAREKPELTPPYQGSSLLLIDQSVSQSVCVFDSDFMYHPSTNQTQFYLKNAAFCRQSASSACEKLQKQNKELEVL